MKNSGDVTVESIFIKLPNDMKIGIFFIKPVQCSVTFDELLGGICQYNWV